MSVLSPERILVPVDFSPRAADALRRAVRMVEADRVLAVHVMLPLELSMSYGARFGTVNDETRRQHVEQAWKVWIEKEALPDVPLQIRIGDPGSVIAAVAEDVGAELILIPARGRHGLLGLGSVSKRVTRFAACTVLVLRGNEEHLGEHHEGANAGSG